MGERWPSARPGSANPERLAVDDQVWCLVQGRLVEVGRAEELLSADGPTANLFGAVGTVSGR